MKDEDGIRRHPFLQRFEMNDADVLFQRPPAFLRMGTILVALALLGFVAFATFIQFHSSVPITLDAEENFTSRGVSDSSCAVPGVSGNLSLQAFGYLSQIGSVRVGQAVLMKEPLCAGGLCVGREGVIVSIAPQSLQRVLVRVRFQQASESDSLRALAQQNGRKISGRIFTRDLFLREPFSTMGEWLFGEGKVLSSPRSQQTG